ncbi:MAG: hypothetical protein OEY63_00360 [Gemmatimonadota bacterium]|nr:hypothetical protein [Gemmatimonadota bacterium]MDH5803894.1 hypothetical protein [Gemmatimonadota bacterium]
MERVMDVGEVREVDKLKEAIPTWGVVLLAALGSVVVTWFGNRVMFDPDFVRALYGSGSTVVAGSATVPGARQVGVVSIVAAPVGVVVRIATMALLIQAVGMMALVEYRFREAFRVAGIAFFAPLLAQAARTLWIARQPLSQVGPEMLYVSPGSLAHWALNPESVGPWLYASLSMVSVFELLWVWIVASLVGQRSGVSYLRAASVATGAWGAMAFCRVVFAVLVFQRFG